MVNRQYYIIKLQSSFIAKEKYIVKTTFEEAKRSSQKANLADGQMLRSVRRITGQKVDLDVLEKLYHRRKVLSNKNSTVQNSKEIEEIQKKIKKMMFIPEYVTVKIESKKTYEKMFKDGFTIIMDGVERHYMRLSCSAGQARDTTVVFCDTKIIDELERVLNNGRDMNYKIAPSKFNAYFGLYGSASKVVSTPRFCVIPDYTNNLDVKVNHVVETGDNEDDDIFTDIVNIAFNRTDGMGVINYEMATKWARELGLSYTPAEFCIRQSFIKGMVCTFPIQEFCEVVNNGCYDIVDIYGKNINLKDYDVILTESQFKLWGAYKDLDYYKEQCIKNHLDWGVAIYTPEKDKDIIKMNYQFLQTLNLSDKDIENICSMFVEWVKSVNSRDFFKTILFLMGESYTESSIKHYMKTSENYWLKCLILDHSLIDDRYIKQKIYNLIKMRIQNGCLGEIMLKGNFQVLVSDPYGFMQHACGLEVTGLLKKDKYYSNFWNVRGVSIVDGMRSPLTYRSEHVKMNLTKNEELEYWFRYLYTGIVVNYHGHETMNWGGSDYDYDILATTDCKEVINGIYENELPVYYIPPKPKKIVPTKKDLFISDTFSFGSIIGSITNKGSSGYALLADLEYIYGKNSKQYTTTVNRLKMSCKLQSAQIDKAKIGRKVKGIPKIWVKREKIEEGDSRDVVMQKVQHNYLCLDRHPYFFIYRYSDTRKKYNKHKKSYEKWAKQKFRKTLDDILISDVKTEEEIEFLENYFKYNPVIDSDSVMNRLCHYIEYVNFDVRKNLKIKEKKSMYKKFVLNDMEWSQKTYENIVGAYEKFCKDSIAYKKQKDVSGSMTDLFDFFVGMLYSYVNEACSNTYEAITYLSYYMYEVKEKSNKEMLWKTYGKEIYSIMLDRSDGIVTMPVLDNSGDIEYIGNKYSVSEFSIK